MVTDWAWLIDIGKELLRVVATIAGVLVGAKIAFSNASKGRREDILFKEKYKVFEYMEVIFKDIRKNYEDVGNKRRTIISNWVSDPLPPMYNYTPPTDEEKLQLVSELFLQCREFYGKNVGRLFDFRVEAMFSKDLEARIYYVSDCLYKYMNETQAITIFIEEAMRNPPPNLAEVKQEKMKEWRYSGGYDKPGSAINMIYAAMFYELELPTEHRTELMPLEEYKDYVFDPGLTLTATLPDGTQISSSSKS